MPRPEEELEVLRRENEELFARNMRLTRRLEKFEELKCVLLERERLDNIAKSTANEKILHLQGLYESLSVRFDAQREMIRKFERLFGKLTSGEARLARKDRRKNGNIVCDQVGQTPAPS